MKASENFNPRFALTSLFGFRILGFLWISDFEIRI
jgi:hypothetical protein